MAGSSNAYWDGDSHAVLTRNNVTADWATGSNAGLSLDASNRAFCILYHARQALKENITSDHWGAMYQSLEECGLSGWSITGIGDMDGACQHFTNNNGTWTDNETTNYYGGNGHAYDWGLVVMPTCLKNFLDAVDSQLPKMTEAMAAYQTHCQALEQIRVAEDNPDDWEQVKTHIDGIKTWAERIKPISWLGPAVVTATVPNTTSGQSVARQIETFAEGIDRPISTAVSTLDAIGNIHDALTIYTEASQAFDDRRVGVAFAALNFALTFVPVLGGFYGTIVQRIPGLVNNWREFIRDYTARFDNPEVYLSSRANQPKAFVCEICT